MRDMRRLFAAPTWLGHWVSLEELLNRAVHVFACWKLVVEEVFGGDAHDLPIELGDRAYPRAPWQGSGRAADKLHMRQSHVPGIMDHSAILDHHKDSVSVT